MPPQPHTTHFGFERVDIAEKTARVRGVFSRVAGKYDLMNDVMSGGLHRLWKDHMIKKLHLHDDMTVLDVAGGTGDITLRMLRQAGIDVTICDINADMLTEGKARQEFTAYPTVDWLCGNAECLPLPSDHFDKITIAFGIRNVTDIPAALSEMTRVLKPGGQFVCLEFSEVTNSALKPVYDAYSFRLIPWLGEKIADDRASYQYLVESIRRFPNAKHFAQMCETAGLSNISYERLSGGIVALHSGWKI